jgi:hypothetical protein
MNALPTVTEKDCDAFREASQDRLKFAKDMKEWVSAEQPVLSDFFLTWWELTGCAHVIPAMCSVLFMLEEARKREEKTREKIPNESFQSLARALKRQSEFRETELRRLSEYPTTVNMATQLTSALIKSLTYLHNYSSLIDEYGNDHSVDETITLLEGFIKDEFKKITGKDYAPDVCRLQDYKRENG